MTLKELRDQLVANNEEQIATTDSVEALTKVMVDRFKLEDRNKLDDMEKLYESRRAPKTTQSRAPAAAGGGFDFSDLLNRFALPALVALGASLTGLDAAIKALKIPDYIRTIRKAIDSIGNGFRALSSKFDTLRLRFMLWGDELRKINIPTLEDIKARIPRITLPESVTQFVDNIRTRIGNIFPSLDDIKTRMPRLALPLAYTTFIDNVSTRMSNIIPSLDDIKTRLPKILLPATWTTFIDNVSTRVSDIIPSLDDIKARLPRITIPIPDAVRNFEMPRFAIPDAIRNLEMPDMTPLKNFLVGTQEGGGVFGFLKNTLSFATDLISKTPGLKFAFRLVGGPVTQALVSLFDFFTGFYRGFVGDLEPQYDEFGNIIPDSRSMMDKVFDGIEGGFDGLLKGIVDGVQLLFIEIPKWILSKLGVDMSWMDNFDLWDDIISPVWEVIKGIPKFIFSPEYRREQMDKVKAAWDEAGGFTGIANSIWDTITGALAGALEFLPTPSELYEKLMSYLPDWMRPEGNNEELARLQEQQEQEASGLGEIARSQGKNIVDLAPVDFQRHHGNQQAGYGARARIRAYMDREERIAELLSELPEGALGGFTNPLSSKLGSLMKIHPNELIVPLGSTPEGQALTKLSKVLNTTASDMQNAQRANAEMSQSIPTVINNIVNDSSVRTSQNVQNRSSFATPVSAVDTSLPVQLN
jgi:hypothetical protein